MVEGQRKKAGTERSRKFLEELKGLSIHLPSSYPPEVTQHRAMVDAAAMERHIRKTDADDALDTG